MKKTNGNLLLIELGELDDYMKAIELQRDIAIGLQVIVRDKERTLKEIETIKNKAQYLAELKRKLNMKRADLKLDVNTINKLNGLLKERHINL